MARGTKTLKSTRLSGLSFFFGLTAFILLWVSGLQCNFIKFTSATYGSSRPLAQEFDIWNYQSVSAVVSSDGTFMFKSCHSYPDYVQMDSSWKAAKAFTVLTFIASLVIIICNSLAACWDFSEISADLKKEAATYVIIGIFQGLTLLFLNSNICKNNVMVKEATDPALSNLEFPDTCSMSTGAKLSIAATVLWFAAAFTAFLGHKTYKEEEKRAETMSILSESLI